MDENLILPHGGYRKLKSFQLARLCHDVTVRFCDRYIDKKSRTRDQMIQAARSGVQNIAEGSKAAGTSKKTELKLTNVARASLEELRLDYEDFLRQRNLPLWPAEDDRRKQLVRQRCQTVEEVVAWVRAVREGNKEDAGNGLDGHDGHDGQHKQLSRATVEPSIRSIESISSIKSITPLPPPPRPTYPEIAANAALVLIGVACALLDRQLDALATAFEKEGGFTERLYRVRTARRKKDGV